MPTRTEIIARIREAEAQGIAIGRHVGAGCYVFLGVYYAIGVQPWRVLEETV